MKNRTDLKRKHIIFTRGKALVKRKGYKIKESNNVKMLIIACARQLFYFLAFNFQKFIS